MNTVDTERSQNEQIKSVEAFGCGDDYSVSLSRWLGCADAKRDRPDHQFVYTKENIHELIEYAKRWPLLWELRLDFTQVKIHLNDAKTKSVMIIPCSLLKEWQKSPIPKMDREPPSQDRDISRDMGALQKDDHSRLMEHH